jgi:hypothetical protein
MWDIRTSHAPVMTFDPQHSDVDTTGMTMALLYRATLGNTSHQVIAGYEGGQMIAWDVRSRRYGSSNRRS